MPDGQREQVDVGDALMVCDGSRADESFVDKRTIRGPELVMWIGTELSQVIDDIGGRDAEAWVFWIAEDANAAVKR